jgi:excisionase family DNA binding protein
MVRDFFTSAVRDVMDIRQAAEYLQISSDTLYRYAAEGFIPAFKLGNRWRFRRVRLEEWMKEQEGSSGKEKVETGIAEG